MHRLSEPSSESDRSDGQLTRPGDAAHFGSRPPATALEAAGRALTLFAVFWAVATIFHQVAYPARHVGAPQYALTFAALWLLLRPSSLVRFLLLAATQAAWTLYSFPNGVTNHWIFTAFVNSAALLAFLCAAIEQKKLSVDRTRFFEIFAPTGRIALVILYFYAVFHKLNASYFNPESSCAVDHYQDIQVALAFLPAGAWTYYLVIVGSLLVESAIPVLLCIRRTRIFGLLLGLSFHFVLAINPNHRFYNFSAMVFAMYFLFLPFDFRSGLRELLASSAAGRRVAAAIDSGAARRWFRGVVWGIIALLLAAYALDADPGASERFLDVMSEVNRTAWVLYGGSVIVILLLVARRWNAVGATARLVSFRPPFAIMFVIPLLLFLNGLSPYLGLKTDTSFSMFSNLRTEGGATNHFIMPGGIRLVGYQDDLVQVVESSVGWLDRQAEEGDLITYFELRRVTAANPEMSITYIRDGKLHVVPRVGDNPELSQHFPTWQRMLFHFRPVALRSENFDCSH